MTASTFLGALVRLAATGFGICAIPKAVISSEPDSGSLLELKTDFTLPSIAFTASYVSDSPMCVFLSRISQNASTFLKPTPPVGLNLYVVQAARKGGSMAEVMLGAIPFVLAMFAMVAALIAFPQLALYLPSAVQ